MEDNGLQRLGRVRVAMKMLSLSVLVEAPKSVAASIHRHSLYRYRRVTWPWKARSTFSKEASDFQKNH